MRRFYLDALSDVIRPLTNFLNLIRRVFALVAPYGRGKLVLVLVFILGNGIMQVIGVTSIFPFIALAAEPDRITNSRFGSAILSLLPQMEYSTLLIWAGVASVTLLFLSNAVTLAGEIVRNRYGYGLAHFLRTTMLNSFACRPYGYFLQRNSGALLQKLLGDVMHFINGVLLPILEIFSRLVTVWLLLLTVFLIHPTIALGAGTLFGSFYTLTFFFLRHHSYRTGQSLKEANRGIFVTAQQFVQGIKPIMVHGRGQHFIRLFSCHSEAHARLSAWLPIYGHAPRYLIEPVAFGGLVLVVIWMASRGRSFTGILPNLTVMALAGYRMLPSFQLIYGQLTQVNAMQYSVAEVEKEIHPLNPAPGLLAKNVSPHHIRFQKEIQLRNITFSYPSSGKEILENFSLSIPYGSSIGIAGSTGSGKSTLIDLLLGLHDPQKGSISVDGRRLTSDDIPAWRAIIGYVPQDIYLLDATLTENIAFGVSPEDVNQEALRTSARAAQILNVIENDLPQAWSTVVGERGVRLSGGQRQRIGLARALYHKPKLLILDEATSALDMETEAAVMKTVRKLQKSVTTVIVAHRLSTLEHCERIIRM